MRVLVGMLLCVGGLYGDDIDQQIEQVNAQIHEARLREMSEELGTQKYLKTEWKEYTEQVEKAEKEEKNIRELKERLKELQEQKRVR